ncbi:MAG: hypothetical protein I3J02_09755 [Prevotella sp.]|nr:hypothetical protein [Prevotella sp.]
MAKITDKCLYGGSYDEHKNMSFCLSVLLHVILKARFVLMFLKMFLCSHYILSFQDILFSPSGNLWYKHLSVILAIGDGPKTKEDVYIFVPSVFLVDKGGGLSTKDTKITNFSFQYFVSGPSPMAKVTDKCLYGVRMMNIKICLSVFLSYYMSF